MYGHQKQGIMTLEEAQKEVDRWIKTYGVRYFSELTNMYCGSLSVWPTRPE